MPMRKRALVALAGTVCLVLAACGTRLDHQEIMSASANTGVAVPGVAAEGQGSTAFGDSLAGGVTGSDSASVPGVSTGSTAGSVAGTGSSAGPVGSSGGSGGATAAVADGSPLVIGTIGAYSGGTVNPLAPGARMLQGWAAAVNDAGGIGGRPVKVIVMDDQGEPGKSKSMMRELVEEHKVDAVVSAMTTPETMGSWLSYAEQQGVPIIGGLCAGEWSTPSPVLFRQCPPKPNFIYGTAKIGADYGQGNGLGLLVCTETNSCSDTEEILVDDGAAKRAGLEVAYNAKISLFASDFTSECIQARNNGVDLMWVVADPGTVARVAASCSRQNYHPQFLQDSASVMGDTVSEPGLGNMLAGMPTFPFAGMSTPAYQEFASVWEQYGDGSAPSPATSLAWASAKLFEQAAASAKGDINRASLIEALRGMSGETLGGLTAPMTFGPQGAAPTNCVFYMRGSGGQWTAPGNGKPICE